MGFAMRGEGLTGKALKILRMMYEMGKPKTVYSIEVKQGVLADKLGISRQALSVHLRKLRDQGYIRTGRGFIDILDKGLDILGVSGNPAIITVKIEPSMRTEVYNEVVKYPILRGFRVAGDVDLILLVEQSKLGDVLQKLASLNGVQNTKSYIAIEVLR